MTQVQSKWSAESVSITHRIDLASNAWDISSPDFIKSCCLPLGTITAIVECFPQPHPKVNSSSLGQQYEMLYIQLDCDIDDITQDPGELKVTSKCGSITRTGSIMLNRLGKFKGLKVKGFPTIQYLKQNPVIYVTLTLIYHAYIAASKKETFSFQQQHELLYTLSRKNGDIMLIVNTGDNDTDLDEPPHKKRRLNGEDEHKEGDDASTMKVSGIVLKCASPVFRNMLSINMMEKQQKTIKVYAKSVKDVDDMIYFMCTNRLRNDANALRLWELANYYQMERLKCKCAYGMLGNISMDDFVDIVNLFDRYAIQERYNELFQFAKQHMDELQKKHLFEKVPHAFTMAVTQIR